MSCKNILCSLLFTSLPLAPFAADADTWTVTIEAGADNTLYEDAAGSYSNGAGASILAGRNNGETDSIRRALLWFDVAGNLPNDAIPEAVTLRLYLERGNGGSREMRLHRLNADWGEGDSFVGGGGQGAPAEPGDATWLHAFYPNSYWGRDGGLYLGRVSAVQTVGDPGTGNDTPATYTWGSTPRLLADVQRWLQSPEKNFGWLLAGDESVPQTAKRFSSRENINPALRPTLEVTYSR